MANRHLTERQLARFTLSPELMVARNTVFSVGTGILPEPHTIKGSHAADMRRKQTRERIRAYAEATGWTMYMISTAMGSLGELWHIHRRDPVALFSGSLQNVCYYIIAFEEQSPNKDAS